VPPVVADDDGFAGVTLRDQPSGDAGGGPADDRAVHAIRPGAQRTAQAGRAERQRPAEPVGQFRLVTAGEQVEQFVRRRRIDLVVDPGLHLRAQVIGDHDRPATSSMPKPGVVKPPPTKPFDASDWPAGTASA